MEEEKNEGKKFWNQMNTKQKFQIQKWTTEVHFSKHDVMMFSLALGKSQEKFASYNTRLGNKKTENGWPGSFKTFP